MATETPPRGQQRLPARFYAMALDAAERDSLLAAEQIDGIDQEIALLRVRLRQAIGQRPDDLQLMFKGIELLVRAVATRYRLSRQSEGELRETLTRAARHLQELAPEVEDHE